jgi:C1A family cysteine protease
VPAVGYDDDMETGRLLNEDGYFWLPYDYVRQTYKARNTSKETYCARDVWVLLNEALAKTLTA